MEYSVRPETPGLRYFSCDRLRANLSTASCSAMWRQANHGGDHEREVCVNCPIGAKHAGARDASLSALRGSRTCCRCHTPALRLIGGMRCVSCYNREREFLRGCNAKGTRPVKVQSLERRGVRYLCGRELKSLTLAHTLDAAEPVVAVLRDSDCRARFGLGNITQPTLAQQRLF